MNLNNKKVLVIGLAKTGISAVKILSKYGAKVVVSDSKTKDELKKELGELNQIKNLEYNLGGEKLNLENIDLAVVSPGVPLDIQIIKNLNENNIKVIGEVELAYNIAKEKNIDFIGITGTNGKTTTTSMTGEIFKAAGFETYVVGNIGNPAIEAADLAKENAVFVIELSSFQLESIDKFKAYASSVLNLSEDHLNRHHTMENYINAKARIFENQDKSSNCILNYDDIETRKLSKNCSANILYFSRKNKVDGIYVDKSNNIIINIKNKEVLMNISELSLPGGHNAENAMAAAMLAYSYGIELSIIKKVLSTFKAVEHRLEYVETIDEVKYVNDSKGTNPDSSIKAVQSYEEPIVLIAGGYDKGSDFEEFLTIAKQNVKALVLIGQTAEFIKEEALKLGFTDIQIVENMKEAVSVCNKKANKGEVVLLSPACASWGMYKNYEIRGCDFKTEVFKLKK